MSGKDIAEMWMRNGLTDDEIVDEFQRFGHSLVWPGAGFPGPRVDVLDSPTSKYGERRLRELLAELRGAEPQGCPPRLRQVESAYRQVGGRPLEKEVAAKMNRTERTVLRYIQEDGIHSWAEMHTHMVDRHNR